MRRCQFSFFRIFFFSKLLEYQNCNNGSLSPPTVLLFLFFCSGANIYSDNLLRILVYADSALLTVLTSDDRNSSVIFSYLATYGCRR